MKILTALTYYRPHISGLTIYAQRVCQALVKRGHQVTVLTSHYDRQLPYREVQEGVEIIRIPVAFRVSKGVVMPTIGWAATYLIPQFDILHLHAPQLDAAGMALRGRLINHPVVLTYHSDLALPPSFFHSVVENVNHLANSVALNFADAIVTNTADFAQHSPLLLHYLHKVQAITPPIEISSPNEKACRSFREKFSIDSEKPLIGIVARISSEKGVEVLLQALPMIFKKFPQARILHVGPREPVGESAYVQSLTPLLEQLGDQYRRLGVVSDEELAAFYSLCDVFVLPSINNTETFGMVQLEAAICGTPSVSSDLPGVRIARQMTGMGLTVPIKDPPALAEAICEIINNPGNHTCNRDQLTKEFSSARTAEQYEQIFEVLTIKKQPPK